jgi:hypothetical protein
MGFRSDSSTPNGSSIAFLAEYRHRGKDVAVLFAGDAHASVLCRSIKQLLAERAAEKLHLDALKVSHHGSRGNTNEQLLSLLDCPRYLISCNGGVHNLPDNETIGRIIAFGGSEPELIFNYHCGRTQAWGDGALQRRYRYSATFGNQGYHRLDLLG